MRNESLSSLTWKEDNPTHAQDMYSILSGTAHDVSMLIDYLPSYLFPTEERSIEWGVMGVSLGGHAVWLCLEKGIRPCFLEDAANRKRIASTGDVVSLDVPLTLN